MNQGVLEYKKGMDSSIPLIKFTFGLNGVLFKSLLTVDGNSAVILMATYMQMTLEVAMF